MFLGDIDSGNAVSCTILMCVRGCVWFGLANILLLMNPWQYKFYFFDLLYGIIHGFDITLDLLLMAWNFRDIL